MHLDRGDNSTGTKRTKAAQIIRASRMMAAATDVWTEVRYLMDVASVNTEGNRRKIDKAKGSLHKSVTNNSGTVNVMGLTVLLARSQIIQDTASAKGWYQAYIAFFSTICPWALSSGFGRRKTR